MLSGTRHTESLRLTKPGVEPGTMRHVSRIHGSIKNMPNLRHLTLEATSPGFDSRDVWNIDAKIFNAISTIHALGSLTIHGMVIGRDTSFPRLSHLRALCLLAFDRRNTHEDFEDDLDHIGQTLLASRKLESLALTFYQPIPQETWTLSTLRKYRHAVPLGLKKLHLGCLCCSTDTEPNVSPDPAPNILSTLTVLSQLKCLILDNWFGCQELPDEYEPWRHDPIILKDATNIQRLAVQQFTPCILKLVEELTGNETQHPRRFTSLKVSRYLLSMAFPDEEELWEIYEANPAEAPVSSRLDENPVADESNLDQGREKRRVKKSFKISEIPEEEMVGTGLWHYLDSPHERY